MQDVFSGRRFKSRGGALAAGIVAALLAAILLIVYLRSYRSSVNSGKQPVPVLVAKTLIPRGMPGELVATSSLYQVTTVRKDRLLTSAITNPGSLTGKIAVHDINPGAQLTTGDFAGVDAGDLRYQLSGAQRAIAVPVDATHGLIGQITPGAKVDVYVAVTSGPARAANEVTGPVVAAARARCPRARRTDELGKLRSWQLQLQCRRASHGAAGAAVRVRCRKCTDLVRLETSSRRVQDTTARRNALILVRTREVTTDGRADQDVRRPGKGHRTA